jgi:hypothetical protein
MIKWLRSSETIVTLLWCAFAFFASWAICQVIR